MFYVHFRDCKPTKNSDFIIINNRINSSDEEFTNYREAVICLNRHRGIVLEDNVLDKYFPVLYEQLKIQ